MSAVLTTPTPGATTPPPATAGYRRWRFTRDDYWKLSELGFFAGQKVELIDGEVVTMAAQGNRHQAGITLGFLTLDRAFGRGYWVRCQGTLNLSPLSQPDPDLSVTPGDPAHPSPDVPTTALLVVEVSYTTLADDRGWKASLYAAAGIADYWVVDLEHDRVEVRRDPRPDPTQPFGHGYFTLLTLVRGDAVTPLAAPAGATVAVADLLPA